MTDTAKQTKQTARIAARARRLRAKNWTWPRISKELGLLSPDGNPNPGLAYKIAVEEYEPSRPEVRERLGLKAVCLTCMRSIRKPAEKVPGALSPWASWWRKLKPAEKDQEIRRAYSRRVVK